MELGLRRQWGFFHLPAMGTDLGLGGGSPCLHRAEIDGIVFLEDGGSGSGIMYGSGRGRFILSIDRLPLIAARSKTDGSR